MSKVTIYTKKVWRCLPKTIKYLLQIDQENLDEEITAGINYTIILNTACLIEGYTEEKLKEVLKFKMNIFHKNKIKDLNNRRQYNIFLNSIEKEIQEKISRCTGVANYDSLFELLSIKKFSSYECMKEIWEGIQVLFNFRNMLAHGREVYALKIESSLYEEKIKENFNGGYKKLETYLLKNKLIDRQFIGSKNENIYLKRNIAEHFWSIAEIYMERIDKIVSDELMYKNIPEEMLKVEQSLKEIFSPESKITKLQDNKWVIIDKNGRELIVENKIMGNEIIE